MRCVRFFLFVFCGLFLLVTSSQDASAWWFWTPGDTVDDVGYKPEQPIPFSHKTHAGDRKIPCQYCHSSARRSTVSGIPPVNTCMGCHKVLPTEKPGTQAIHDHFKENKTIPWVKVHDLPDFVRFSHKIHLNSGLECQQCHGRVEEMDVVEQVAPLQMGWCIGCHQEKNAKLDCMACHY